MVIIMLLLLAVAVIVLCSPGWRSPANAAAAILSLVVMGLAIWALLARSRGH